MPPDGALACARAHRVRERHVLVEDDAELDDPEEEEREQGKDESELRHRLALLSSVRRTSWRRKLHENLMCLGLECGRASS
jgi:hypothetical protein